MISLTIETIQKVKNGDRIAFKQLYEAYSSYVFNTSFKILKESSIAEEVVQECFVKVWVNRESLEITRDIKPYLFVITKRICLNHLRSSNYLLNYLEELRLTNVNDVEQKVDCLDLERILLDRIEILPTQQKTALKMSRIEGFTHLQIAEKMNLSPNTVKNHITKALSDLRKFLITRNYEAPILLIFLLY